MKAISLWQPWASAIAVGAKTIETRSWSTPYRGRLAIHAAKHWDRDSATIVTAFGFRGALAPLADPCADFITLHKALPMGAIVAVCDLVDCRPTGRFTGDQLDTPRNPDRARLSDEAKALSPGFWSWTEREMGDFSPGRFGWVLANVRRLDKPVYFRGAQGLFDVPEGLVT